MALSHNELAHSLASYLVNDNRMVWEDIPAGKSGSIRPDVLTIQKSFSNPNPISYEIKVSASDFRSDVTSGKWSKYLDFSYGVVFAAPKGLIKKSDIPDICGLIQFDGQSWRTVKKPILNPAVLNGELLLKLLIAGKDRETQANVIKNRGFDEWEHKETLRKKFGKDFAKKIKLIETYDECKKELDGYKKELGSLFGLDINEWSFIYDLSRSIKDLKILADEGKRKEKIAKDLRVMKNHLDSRIDAIVENYTTN